MENKRNDLSDRESRTSRVLDAPIELVWEVWSTPEHIAQWWAPNGFTNTVDLLEMRPGGRWHMLLRGPDGTEHVVQSVFREVVPFRRLVFEAHDHLGDLKFIVTVEFEARGPKTLLNWHALFETAEQFIEMAETRKGDEGLRQVLEKLNHYLLARIKNK